MTTAGVHHRPHLSPAAETQDSVLSQVLRSACIYLTVAILVFGPLAFGAVEPWSMLLLHIGASVAFLLWLLANLASKRASLDLQAIHLPPFLFACLVVGQILLGGTVYHHETVTQFLNYVAYGLIFLISTDIFRNEREARLLCLTLAVLGFALAFLGSVQEFTSPGKLYWVRTPRQGGPIFGPYVNRNHYAGVMELLFPFAVLGSMRPGPSLSKRVMLGFAALLMIATVFLCASRGGFVCVVLQSVLLGVMLLWRSRKLALVLALTLLFIVTGAFGIWLGSDQLLGRLGQIGDDAGRVQIAKDSIRMFERHPVTGWGLGTFPIAYPKFRTFATDLFVNEAHNDFVQLLVETGLLGFATGIVLLVLVYVRGFRRISHTLLGSWRAVAVGASLVGVTGLAIHSLFDFNLQIPANALLFYVLCAVAGSTSEEDAQVVRRIDKDGVFSVIDV
ncbi:MAG TPA: O-antigen ligase family protein [Terriglobales bacterium]|nr:O-antigen ligase family protein [Terriglobales bacterium]